MDGPRASVEVGAPRYELSADDDEPLTFGPRHLVHGLPRRRRRRHPDTTRLAANTLLWSKDGVVLRMESSLDRASAISLASQLAPL